MDERERTTLERLNDLLQQVALLSSQLKREAQVAAGDATALETTARVCVNTAREFRPGA